MSCHGKKLFYSHRCVFGRTISLPSFNALRCKLVKIDFCIMRVGHVFVGLVFLWALRVSECPLNNVSSTSRHLTSCCNLGAYFPSSNTIFGGRNWSFVDRLSVPLDFLDSLYCVHNNSYGVGSNEPLEFGRRNKDSFSHSLLWICKNKIRTSFINQGEVQTP